MTRMRRKLPLASRGNPTRSMSLHKRCFASQSREMSIARCNLFESNALQVGSFEANPTSDGCGEIGGEGDSVIQVLREQAFEVLLVDRNSALAESGDFGLVVVDAGHLMAHLGEADGSYETNVSGADHTNRYRI